MQNCESCPTQVSWRVKFRWQSCLSCRLSWLYCLSGLSGLSCMPEYALNAASITLKSRPFATEWRGYMVTLLGIELRLAKKFRGSKNQHTVVLLFCRENFATIDHVSNSCPKVENRTIYFSPSISLAGICFEQKYFYQAQVRSLPCLVSHCTKGLSH